jgi:hypothetical protein
MWLSLDFQIDNVATPLLEECEDDTHTLEMGTWESSGTPKTSKFDCKGQNTLPWDIPYIIRNLSKCKCQKSPCMSHLDICSTSYYKKKGWEGPRIKLIVWLSTIKSWESTRPRCVQVECNTPLESYKFASNLILIRGLNKELWIRKVQGV